MKLQALDVVLAVGVAEVRRAGRLARTRVFLALSSAVVLTAYGFYFAAHGYWSAPAPEMGYFSPRFHASPINLHLLWIFLAGPLSWVVSARASYSRSCVDETLVGRSARTNSHWSPPA